MSSMTGGKIEKNSFFFLIKSIFNNFCWKVFAVNCLIIIAKIMAKFRNNS